MKTLQQNPFIEGFALIGGQIFYVIFNLLSGLFMLVGAAVCFVGIGLGSVAGFFSELADKVTQ